MWRLWCFAGLLAGWVCLSFGQAQQPNEAAVKAFMRAKLNASANVLEGLVTEDFNRMREGAGQMRVMSQQAEWHVLKTPDYVQYSAEFQRNLQRLIEAATEKKLDSASLAYTQLTLTCINCHKHVRNAKVADARPSNPAVTVALANLIQEN